MRIPGVGSKAFGPVLNENAWLRPASQILRSKKLVGSVAAEDTLSLCVARGTGVLEDYESAVVELCHNTGVSDQEVETCVTEFLDAGYATTDYGVDKVFDDVEAIDEECNFDDAESDCMVDGIMNMWADDLPLPPTTSGISDQPAAAEMKSHQRKPWSNRGSPSGTWVRDPKTGEMRNIDA